MEIPNAIYGIYYIIIVTDVRNDVYEYLDENDNNIFTSEVSCCSTYSMYVLQKKNYNHNKEYTCIPLHLCAVNQYVKHANV